MSIKGLTQSELFEEYIRLHNQRLEAYPSQEDELLDKMDEVWYAMDKETMAKVEEYLIGDEK